MAIKEKESQVKSAQFNGELPSGADVEINLSLNVDTNIAHLRMRLNDSAGLQGLANDLKTIRNFLIQKYNLTP